jgi:protein TonB
VVFLPNLFKSNTSKSAATTGQIVDVNMTNLDANKAKDNVLPIVPPEVLKPTIKFVSMVVVPDELVSPEDRVATQIELSDAAAQISVVTVTGDPSGTVDIRDVDIITDVPATPKDPIPSFVEQMPQFPGGEKEMMSWLSSHIQYPAIAAEKGIQGRVVLRFVVRPDGSIDDVTVVKSLEPSCDKEAIRAVKSMPKWIPGRQNGNPVSVYYNIPVQFRLQIR